jgi:uncharacterized phage protein gp47/JayE
MSGVTSTGFSAKRLSDILTEAEADLALITDPVSGESLQADFTSADPAMQVVKVPLDAVGSAWELAQVVYEQFDPNKSSGASLSSLVELNGLLRQPATFSTATLSLAGTPGTNIPAGQLVSDTDNTVQWATDTAVLLDGSGLGQTGATALTSGPIAAAAGTLDSIVTPVAGWASVTNAAEASIGKVEETDDELRPRRARSTMAPAASPVESVYSNLANVPGVTYARVYQNNTVATDSRGIEPKSVAAVLVGGADVTIAQVLLARTGVSSGWHGTTVVTLYDVQNEPYAVRFSRPTPRPVYVAITIQITNPSVFPGDGIDQIKQAIVAYAIGGAPALGIEDGFSKSGFPPGESVILTRLYTPINYVPGHRVTQLFIGLAPAPTGTTDIPMAWNEYGQFSVGAISVTVAP